MDHKFIYLHRSPMRIWPPNRVQVTNASYRTHISGKYEYTYQDGKKLFEKQKDHMKCSDSKILTQIEVGSCFKKLC